MSVKTTCKSLAFLLLFILTIATYSGCSGCDDSDSKTGATDGELASCPNNKQPIANAGADRLGYTGSEVTLDASLSSDPDDQEIITYDWEVDQAPENADFYFIESQDRIRPTITLNTAGDYELSLVVTDLAPEPPEGLVCSTSSAISEPDTVSLRVIDRPDTDSAPTIVEATPAERTHILEVGEAITLYVKATDAENEVIINWYVAGDFSGVSSEFEGEAWFEFVADEIYAGQLVEIFARISDGGHEIEVLWQIAVTGVDCQSPPALTSRTPEDSDLQFRLDQAQVFTAVFEAADDAPLNRYWFFEGVQVGSGLNYSYTANEDDLDEVRKLELLATDGSCFSSTYWTIRSAPNEPPTVVLLPSSTEFTVNHNQTLSFSVDAEDPENLPLTYAWVAHMKQLDLYTPFSNSFSDVTVEGSGLFFRPEIGNLNAGTNLTVNLTVDDSREQFNYSWLVHIEPHRAPVITAVSNLQGEEGDSLSAVASIADADLDPIYAYLTSVDDCASEAYIVKDGAAGTITFGWDTDFDTVSGHAADDTLICDVTITIRDDTVPAPLSDSAAFTVTVSNAESFRSISPQASTDYVIYNNLLVQGETPYVAYSSKIPNPAWPYLAEPCEVRVTHFDGSDWIDDSGDLSEDENNTALSRPELFMHNGLLHVAYSSGTSTTVEGADAHVKKFDGSVWSEVGAAAPDAGAAVHVDRVKAASDGTNIYLAYYQTPTTPAVTHFGSHYSLYVSQYDELNGWQVLGPEINSGSEDFTANVSQRILDIAVDPAGTVYVAYVKQDYIASSELSIGLGYVVYYDSGSGQWLNVLNDPLNYGNLAAGQVSSYISGLDLEFVDDQLYVAVVDSALDWYYNVSAVGNLRVYTPEAGQWSIVGEKLNDTALALRASYPRLLQYDGQLYITFGQDLFYDNHMVEPIGYGFVRQLVGNAWEGIGFALNNNSPINVFAGIGFGISSSGEYFATMTETGLFSNVGSRLYLYHYSY